MEGERERGERRGVRERREEGVLSWKEGRERGRRERRRRREKVKLEGREGKKESMEGGKKKWTKGEKVEEGG